MAFRRRSFREDPEINFIPLIDVLLVADVARLATGDRRVAVVAGLLAAWQPAFVWGALSEARQRGAITALICFNPHLDFREGWKPEVVLAVDVGPEILTGSTRLKAGTATKLLLNQLTTLAMIQTGKVLGNLMVDLNPSNVKLRDRACRIVNSTDGEIESACI